MPTKVSRPSPSVKVIPEEVLHQVYQNHYALPTRKEVAQADLSFQDQNKFLPWQSLPESLLHELDLEVSPRLTVYGYCSLDRTACIPSATAVATSAPAPTSYPCTSASMPQKKNA